MAVALRDEGTSGSRRDADSPLRQTENHAAGGAIRGGTVSTLPSTNAIRPNDWAVARETPADAAS